MVLQKSDVHPQLWSWLTLITPLCWCRRMASLCAHLHGAIEGPVPQRARRVAALRPSVRRAVRCLPRAVRSEGAGSRARLRQLAVLCLATGEQPAHRHRMHAAVKVVTLLTSAVSCR